MSIIFHTLLLFLFSSVACEKPHIQKIESLEHLEEFGFTFDSEHPEIFFEHGELTVTTDPEGHRLLNRDQTIGEMMDHEAFMREMNGNGGGLRDLQRWKSAAGCTSNACPSSYASGVNRDIKLVVTIPNINDTRLCGMLNCISGCDSMTWKCEENACSITAGGNMLTYSAIYPQRCCRIDGFYNSPPNDFGTLCGSAPQ